MGDWGNVPNRGLGVFRNGELAEFSQWEMCGISPMGDLVTFRNGWGNPNGGLGNYLNRGFVDFPYWGI